MTHDDYKLAVWKLNRSAVPKGEVLDWLHEAVIEWYEQGQPHIEHGLGNWLGLVAWRKWKSHTKSASYRKTVLWGEAENIPDNAEEKDQSVVEDLLAEMAKELTKTQKRCLDIWARGLNCEQAGLAIGRSKQSVSQV